MTVPLRSRGGLVFVSLRLRGGLVNGGGMVLSKTYWPRETSIENVCL
jgi:hypothetical protein